MRTWVVSDHHFGHANIIKFEDKYGNKIRPFSCVEEHDETIISNHNNVVDPKDRVYLLGDVAISKKSIDKIGRLNGRKVLIKGNHDIFKLQDYLPYVDDVRSCKIYQEHGIIITHFPVHTGQLVKRWKLNIHGHLHQNIVESSPNHPDNRYINVCLEHTNYYPTDLDYIIKLAKSIN